MRAARFGDIRSTFCISLDSIKRLVDSGQMTAGTEGDISRETRGLAQVMLFASYERLLKSMCREIIEAAKSHQGKQKNLRKCFQVIGMTRTFESLRDQGQKKVWIDAAPKVFDMRDKPSSEISADFFPDDGSFMRETQVKCFCDFFDLPNPEPILEKAWNMIPAVTNARNGIAHGVLTAEEVGRNMSYSDTIGQISTWQEKWLLFVDFVESIVGSETYYLSKA